MADPAAPRPTEGSEDPGAAPRLPEPSPASHDAVGAAAFARGLKRAMVELLRVLPQNALSRLAGRLATVSLPGPLQRAEIRLFARLTGIDLAEVRDPIDAFHSLQQFFTRALRPGLRPIEGDARTLVSPCDGRWGESGRIRDGTLLQVKGRRYAVAELLGDPDRAARYEGGWFATFYLSPRDYHRFHTPLAGRFVRFDHRPGALWPVNSIGLEGVDALFARNERVCAYLQPDPEIAPVRDAAGAGEASDAVEEAIVLVAVGATMVGSVRLVFHEMTTNVAGAEPTTRRLDARAPHFDRGAEWGHFEFGSTIVLLLPEHGFVLDPAPVGTPLRQGRAIGRIG